MDWYLATLVAAFLAKCQQVITFIAIMLEHLGTLLAMGEFCYCELENHPDTIKYYEQALEIIQVVGNKELECIVYRKLGYVYHFLPVDNEETKFSKALEYYQKALRIANTTGLRAQEAVTLLVLGLLCIDENYHDAVIYLEQGLAIALDIENKKLAYDICRLLAHTHLNYNLANNSEVSKENKYKTAIEYFQVALEIAKSGALKKEETETLLRLGNLFNGLIQNYHDAIKYYEQGLAIAQEMGNEKLQYLLCSRLGEAHCALGKHGDAKVSREEYEEALTYYQVASEITTCTESKEKEAQTLLRLGDLFNESIQNYHDAIKYYEQGLAIAQEMNNEELQYLLCSRLGEAHNALAKHSDAMVSKEEYEEAIEFCQIALEIAKSTESREREVHMLSWLGMLSVESVKNYHDAIEYYEQGLAIAQEMDNEELQCRMYLACATTLFLYNEPNFSKERNEKVIDYFQKVLEIGKDLSKEVEKTIYRFLGVSCLRSNKYYNDGITYLERALAIAQEIGDKEQECSLYFECSCALWAQVNVSREDITNKVFEYSQKALILAKDNAFKISEALILTVLGCVSASTMLFKYTENDPINYIKQALAITQEIKEIGFTEVEYELCTLLGYLYDDCREYQNSITFYNKALDIAKQLGNEPDIGHCYAYLSKVYQHQGKLDDAIHFQEETLKICDKIGYKELQVTSLCTLGNTYLNIKKPVKAVEVFQQSLDIAKEMSENDIVDIELVCCVNLGNAYKRMAHYEKAIAMYLRELKTAKELDAKLFQATYHEKIGECYFKSNHYEHAMEHYQNGIAIAKEINAKTVELSLYHKLALLHVKTDELNEALIMVTKALDINEQIGGSEFDTARNEMQHNFRINIAKVIEVLRTETYDLLTFHNRFFNANDARIMVKLLNMADVGEYQIYGLAGRVYYLLGNNNKDQESYESYMSKSEEYLKKALDCCDYLSTNRAHFDQLTISLLDIFAENYKLLTTVLIETQQSKQALLESDRGRARALAHSLTFAYGMSTEKYLSAKNLTYADIESVCSKYAFTMLHYSLLDESLAVWVIAKDSMPKLKVVDKDDFISVMEKRFGEKRKDKNVQRCFEKAVARAYDDMKIKEAVTCENKSLNDCLISTEQQCDSVPESVSRGESVESDLHPLEVLYNTLIAPVLSDVQHDEIVIVPDGKMYTVPFAALIDPNTGMYLSDTKRIRLIPSIAVLKLLQECPVDHHSKQGALIVGNPTVGEVMFKREERTFNDLYFAGVEATCISNILEDAVQRRNADTIVETLTEQDATKDAVLAKMKEGVAIIHIAAHGCPDTGEIVLAPNKSQDRQGIPEEQDYLLTMKEVQEVGIKAQLVVLSCCYSGLGEIRAEGMIGLSRAFLAAGARAVVASLWDISDDVTYDFMLNFYESLCKGDSASVSLDFAMKEIRGEDKDMLPKYWAPFLLFGDDVTINFGHTSDVQ